MNILIIAKEYHAKKSARAIQMRRVINALSEFKDHNLILITEGSISQNIVTDKLRIINIPHRKRSFALALKIFEHFICSTLCFKKNDFIKNAVQIGLELVDQNKIDTLLTVSTPFASHLAGLEIKRNCANLKWVTFFSDLWPTAILPKPYQVKKLLSYKELKLLKNVLLNSDIVLTPSSYAVQDFRKVVQTKAIFKTVPHCAIPEDRHCDKALNGYILHVGFLTRERIKEDLVIAIDELSRELPGFKGLIHIGPCHSSFRKMIRKHNCSSIHLMGHLSEDLATSIQQMASISLVIEAPMEKSPFIPSKITDSIRNSYKVIAITPTQSFLSEYSFLHDGLYACTYNKDKIKECIKGVFSSQEIINNTALDFFSPKSIANEYDKILENEAVNF